MPSPIGHMLSGVAIGLAAMRPADRQSEVRQLAICAILAAAPDLDLLVSGTHRTATHSLLAVGLVAILGVLATRLLTPSVQWRLVVAWSLAYASHLLTDYFGVDRGSPAGLQLFWPWRDEWFISGWALFLSTDRRDVFSARTIDANVRAILREIVLLGPVVWFLWAGRSQPPKTGNAGRSDTR